MTFSSAWDIHRELESGLGPSSAVVNYRGPSSFLKNLTRTFESVPGASPHLFVGIVSGDYGVRYGPATDKAGKAVNAIALPTEYNKIPGLKRIGSQIYSQLHEGILSGQVAVGLGRDESLNNALKFAIKGHGNSPASVVNSRMAKAITTWKTHRLESVTTGQVLPGSTGAKDILGSAFHSRQALIYLDSDLSLVRSAEELSRKMAMGVGSGNFQEILHEFKEFHRGLSRRISGAHFSHSDGTYTGMSFMGIKDTSPFVVDRVSEMVGADGQVRLTKFQSSAVRVQLGELGDYIAMPEYADFIGDMRHRMSGLGIMRAAAKTPFILSPAMGGRAIAEIEREAMALAAPGVEGIGMRANVSLLSGAGSTVYWNRFGPGDPGVYVKSNRMANALAATTGGYTIDLPGIAERSYRGEGRGRIADRVRQNLRTILDSHGVSLDEMLASEKGGSLTFETPFSVEDLTGLPRRANGRTSPLNRALGFITGKDRTSMIQGRSVADQVVGVEISGSKIKFHMRQHDAPMLSGTIMVVNEARASARLGAAFRGMGGPMRPIDLVGEASSLKMGSAEGLRSTYARHYLAVAMEAAGPDRGVQSLFAEEVANALGMDYVEGLHAPILVGRERAAQDAAYRTGEMFTTSFTDRLEKTLGLEPGALVPKRTLLQGERLESMARDLIADSPNLTMAQAVERLSGLYLTDYLGQDTLVRATNPLSMPNRGKMSGRMKLRAARTYRDAVRSSAERGGAASKKLLEALDSSIVTTEGRISQVREMMLAPWMTEEQIQNAINKTGPGRRAVKRLKLSDLRNNPETTKLWSRMNQEYEANKTFSKNSFDELLRLHGVDKDTAGVLLELDDDVARGIPYILQRPTADGVSGATMLGAGDEFGRVFLPNPDFNLKTLTTDDPSGWLGGMRRFSHAIFAGGKKAAHERGSFRSENLVSLALELMNPSIDKGNLSRRLTAMTLSVVESATGSMGKGTKEIVRGISSTQLVAQNASGLAVGEVGMTEKTFKRLFKQSYGKVSDKAQYERELQEALWRAKNGEQYHSFVRYPAHSEVQIYTGRIKLMRSNTVRNALRHQKRGMLTRVKEYLHGVVLVGEDFQVRGQGDNDGDTLAAIAQKSGPGRPSMAEVNAANKEMYEANLPQYKEMAERRAVRTAEMDARVARFAEQIRGGQASFGTPAFQEMMGTPRGQATLADMVETHKIETEAQLDKLFKAGAVPTAEEMAEKIAAGKATAAAQYSGSSVGPIHAWMEKQHAVMNHLMGRERYYDVAADDPRIKAFGKRITDILGRDLTSADKAIHSEMFYRFLKKRTSQQEKTAELFDLVAKYAKGDRTEEVVRRGGILMREGLTLKDFAGPSRERLVEGGHKGARKIYEDTFRMMGEIQATINEAREAGMQVLPDVALRSSREPTNLFEKLAVEAGLDPAEIQARSNIPVAAAAQAGEELPGMISPAVASDTVDNVSRAASEEMKAAVKASQEAERKTTVAIGNAVQQITESSWTKYAAVGAIALGAIALFKPSPPERRRPTVDDEEFAGYGPPMPPSPHVGHPLDSMDGAPGAFPETARINRVLGQRTHFADVHSADIMMPSIDRGGGRSDYVDRSYQRNSNR